MDIIRRNPVPSRTPMPQNPGSENPISHHGGIMYKRQFDKHISRLPLTRMDREYVKRVYEKYESKLSEGKKGVTPGEFAKGLDEMAKNQRDQITQEKVDRIKKFFK